MPRPRGPPRFLCPNRSGYGQVYLADVPESDSLSEAEDA